MRIILALGLFAWLGSTTADAAPCESLTSVSADTMTVTRAEQVAGACRVAVTLKPSPRSSIKSEVWLPVSGWNGKLQVVGNGGFAGTIPSRAMETALAAGYATAGTDTGHTGPTANTFVNEDVFIDYAYRAIHETTVAAKKLVTGFYGSAPRFSYFSGCSTGGRQAMQAVQRYPEDFDAVVAGAPGVRPTRQAFAQNWMYQATADPASALPREALELLHGAVLTACDALDGVKDGVLENPRACTFDPKVIACEDAPEAGCLKPAQVEAAQKIYAGPSNPRTGERLFAGLERGSELGWGPGPVGLAADFFRYVVFKDPNWDPKTLNFDEHVALVDSKAEHRIMDATSVDLSAFTRRGGKLILYQGWAENGIPPGNVVTYYDAVRAKTANASTAVRLFMVPGMGHCGGGNGTSTFDMVAAVDQWKTTGKAPPSVPASRVVNGKVDRTRPLCAYPQIAVYKGSGSTDDAANFACRVAK